MAKKQSQTTIESGSENDLLNSLKKELGCADLEKVEKFISTRINFT